MVTAAVHHAFLPVLGIYLLEVLIFVIEGTAGTVGLGAHDGLEDLSLHTLQLLLQLAQLGRPLRHLGVGIQLLHLLDLGLQLLDAVLHLAVLLIHRIQQILDTEHITMIRQGHGIHSVVLGLLDEVGDFRHPVEHRIMRVYVQVCKVHHRKGEL